MINRVKLHVERSSNELPNIGRSRRGLRRWLVGLTMLFGIALVGCSQGSYPVDIFYEQHYKQS